MKADFRSRPPASPRADRFPLSRRLVFGLLALLASGCGGSLSRTTIASTPPPPPAAEPAEPAQTEEPPDSTPPPPPEDEPATAPDPLLQARGYPAAVRIGALVADIRPEPADLELAVGDSLAVGEDVEFVAYNAEGIRVSGVRILTNIDSRFAALEEGFIHGIAEGDAEVRLAIQAPPASGSGPPEIRTFAAQLRVVGPPVASVEIDEPGVRFLAGSVVRLHARALAEDGSLRERVGVEWSSDRRRLATVDSRGFVHALAPGAVTVTASAEGVEGTFSFQVEENPVEAVEVSGASRARTGDVVRFSILARDGAGTEVQGAPTAFSVTSFAERTNSGASIYPDGAFVAERPGLYRVVADVAGRTGQALVEVVERGVEHDAFVVGRGVVADRPTSDLWAFTGNDGRDYVYTGTHDGGQRMLVWDVTEPGTPVITDFVEVDARVVNDVKVNPDATLAVITREGARDRRNGIILLDLADPAHPTIASTYTSELTGGVHNVFFAGDILYAVHNGTFDVHVLNISDPGRVVEVGRWGIESPGKYLHDIWVVDGLAYVSYWNDGVVILDVGNGGWGGLPAVPVEVSRHAYPEGNTHFAVPYTNADGHRYLFVGDEIFDCDDCVSRNGHPGDGSRGFVHILDLEDPENLREVARYEVPEAGAHNLWIEDDRMYVAYYQAGLRVVDISGELRGDLYRQGREMAWLPTGSPDGFVPNSPMAWGPQWFKGHIYVSDLNSGLWVVRIEPRRKAPVS